MLEMKKVKERVILVGLGKDYIEETDSIDVNPLEELKLLTETAGAEVVGSVTQARSKVDPRYFIGVGKAQELSDHVKSLNATTVIFDNDLSPAQVSNLQKLLEIKVIDRSGLILDIFALRAKTREAKTQVELAQLKHLLPQLTRQWTHLSRQVGGIGVRGPGETQLEVDRRRIRSRISHLTLSLKKIEKRHSVSRSGRKSCYKITLVGYTNAGKSTLFNVLSRANAPVEDKLFKTLDSMTRVVNFNNTPPILLTDTVGFIRNLPHELIASFKSTLSDVKDADLLLHVIDVTNPGWKEQIDTVDTVLKDLDSSDKQIIMVFNKIDAFENSSMFHSLKHIYHSSVIISAQNGTGIDDLKNTIQEMTQQGRITFTMEFSQDDSSLLHDIYRYGIILESRTHNDSLTLTFSLSESQAHKMKLGKNA